MPPDKSEIAARAATIVAGAGQNWNRLLDEAAEVVVFGSTAAGVAGPHSDVDILVVGAARPRKTRELDVVVETPETIRTPDWLGSELAGHIAAYGVWLKGDSLWVPHVRIGELALDRKRARIQRLIAAAQRHWPRLDSDFRRRSLATIRRELQRELLLERSIPIPPTPELDAACATGESGQQLPAWIRELLSADLRDVSPRVLDRLAREAPQPSSAWVKAARTR
ncbi:MAG: nucleotidyltransferase domain-containing protein [Bryobacteraceae bacterium]